MKGAATLLLKRQEGPVAAICAIPPTLVDTHTAMAIVAHTVAVTLCRQKADVLLPFKTMLNDPSTLAVSNNYDLCLSLYVLLLLLIVCNL